MDNALRANLERILTALKKNPNILSVALMGSQAQKDADSWSDVDLFAVIEKDRGLARTKTVAAGRTFEIIFNTLEEARGYLNYEKCTTHRNTAHMIVNSRLLWERKPVWAKLQRFANDKVLASKNRREIKGVLMHKYSVDDYLAKAARASAHDDAIGFALASRFVIDNCLELLLTFNDKYWLPIKHMDNLIMSLDRTFYRLLRSFYAEKNQRQAQAFLNKLAARAIKIASGPLPNDWSIKR